MHIELKGHKAIITGSTAGIGRAIAERLARAGASVVVNGRTQERVDFALREIHALLPHAELSGVAADVATAEGYAALIAHEPDADILVNNAGIAGSRKPAAELTGEDAESVFATNVVGPVCVMNAFIPLMEMSSNPVIVNVSSGLGSFAVTQDPQRFESQIRLPLYCASKSALTMFTLQYARVAGFSYQCGRSRLYGHGFQCAPWSANRRGRN